MLSFGGRHLRAQVLNNFARMVANQDTKKVTFCNYPFVFKIESQLPLLLISVSIQSTLYLPSILIWSFVKSLGYTACTENVAHWKVAMQFSETRNTRKSEMTMHAEIELQRFESVIHRPFDTIRPITFMITTAKESIFFHSFGLSNWFRIKIFSSWAYWTRLSHYLQLTPLLSISSFSFQLLKPYHPNELHCLPRAQKPQTPIKQNTAVWRMHGKWEMNRDEI